MKLGSLRSSVLSWSAISLVAGLLSGCADLSVRVANPLVESPEIGASAPLEFGAGVEDATYYAMTSDGSVRPPRTNAPRVDKSARDFAKLGLALAPWLELGVRTSTASLFSSGLQGLGGTARVQWIGAGRDEGWKAAVFGGYVGSSGKAQGDQNGTFGPGGYKWEGSAFARTVTAGASAGYRFPKPQLLLFVGWSYADQRVWGQLVQQASDNGQDAGGTYDFAPVSGRAQTTALGLRVGHQVQGMLEVRSVTRDWPGFVEGGGSRTETQWLLGLSVQPGSGSFGRSASSAAGTP